MCIRFSSQSWLKGNKHLETRRKPKKTSENLAFLQIFHGFFNRNPQLPAWANIGSRCDICWATQSGWTIQELPIVTIGKKLICRCKDIYIYIHTGIYIPVLSMEYNTNIQYRDIYDIYIYIYTHVYIYICLW